MRSHFSRITVIAATLMLAAGTAAAQEASDQLATATEIAAVPFSALTDTSTATSDPATEPLPSCIFMPPAPPPGFGGGSVWYRYTAPADGTLTADTFGSSYDTVLVVWDGGPTGAEVGCNDDNLGLQSQVQFPTQAGHTYYFQIAFWRGYDPTIDPPPVLAFQLAPPLPPLEVVATIDPVGLAAGATGVVEITGTITCSRPAFVFGMLHVQQQHGRIAAAGLFLQGPCGPQPAQAIARFVGQNARFTPGQATATVSGFADEFPLGGVPFSSTATVRLQGASPKQLALPPPPAP